MRSANAVKSICAVALILALATSLALAENPNPKVLPINSAPCGQSYGAWGDAWWQWAMSIPADMNPVMDTTGEFAAVGQSGPVWFLAGTYGGEAERTVTIPAGKALFFPIYNWLWINFPLLGDDPWSAEQEAFIRAWIAEQMDTVAPEDLMCEIDGRPVADLLSYRCATPPGAAFMVDLPENDPRGLVGLEDINGNPIQPGLYGPSIQEGIYLMVAPLSAGEHTIHFSAAGAVDVTDNLTVLK